MKKVLCMLLAALFLLSSCGAPAPAPENAAESGGQPEPTAAPEPSAALYPGDTGFRYEGDGFDTPEDATLYYLAGLKNLNYEQMLHAFAWETQAERFNFRAFLAYMKNYDPYSTIPMTPSEDELTLSANLETLRGTRSSRIYLSLAAFANQDAFPDGRTMVTVQDDAGYDAYVQGFDMERIGKLKEMDHVRFYSPDDVTGKYYSGEKVQAKIRDLTAVYGADEIRDVVAVADIGDETIGIAPTTARYGNKWYIVFMDSLTYTRLARDLVSGAGIAVVPDEMKTALLSLNPTLSADLPDTEFAGFRYEGDGFDTPEEAVVCYLEGLKNRNMQQMLKAFAWETQSRCYSLKDYSRIVYSVNLYNGIGMPSLNDFFIAANLVNGRFAKSRTIGMAVRAFILNGEEMPIQQMANRVMLKNDEETDAFLALFRNDRTKQFAEMTNIRTMAPEALIPSYSQTELVQKWLDNYRAVYGADEVRDIVGIADFGDETLFCNPVAARYGDKWYLVELRGGAVILMEVYYSLKSEQQAFLTWKGTVEDAAQYLINTRR